MILYIDTTDFNKATFAAQDGKKIRKRSYKIDPRKSHETLGFLDAFLKSHGIKSTSPAPRTHSGHPPHLLGRAIRKIYVNKGPGSYTGVRVGVTLAMALGFAWSVPVCPIAASKFKIT